MSMRGDLMTIRTVYLIDKNGAYVHVDYYADDVYSATRQAKAEYGREIRILQVEVKK